MILGGILIKVLPLWLLSVVAGQTYSVCNPLQAHCAPNKALGKTISANFSQGSVPNFSSKGQKHQIHYGDNGVEFVVAERGDNPYLMSQFYIMFGRLEVNMRGAGGRGIVSSIVMQSDDLDEIDIELVGSDTAQFQTNYFSKGNTSTYDRGAYHHLYGPQSGFHNYTIDWTAERIEWYVDGELVRKLESSEVVDQGYPQTPMSIRMGSWAAGDPLLNQPGTVAWAGGAVNYVEGPFVFSVRTVKVEDYSTGTHYVYGDRSGSWQSSQSVGGRVKPGKSRGLLKLLETLRLRKSLNESMIQDETAATAQVTAMGEPILLEEKNGGTVGAPQMLVSLLAFLLITFT